MLRKTTLLLGAWLLLAAGSDFRPQADAAVFTSEEHNCEFKIPDTPAAAAWSWQPIDGGWAKYGIVKGAERRVSTLKNGQPASGQGAMAHLAVRDLPAEATLESVVADAATREFLRARFTQVEGDFKVGDNTLEGGIPTKILSLEGKATNFGGVESMCKGVMLICVHRARMYFLRMYAWPSDKYDQEGVVSDLDFMEMDGLRLLDTKEAAKPEAPPPSEEGDGAVDEPPTTGKEERIELETHEIVLVKPARLDRLEEEEKEEDKIILYLSGSHDDSSYHVVLYAYPAGDGKTTRTTDPSELVGVGFYRSFLENHPGGAIYKFPFPKKPTAAKVKTFLLLPELTPEARKVVFDDKKKKRDPEASRSDIEKLGFYESPKDKFVGAEFKSVGPTHRAVMSGNAERYGDQTILKYGWQSTWGTFVLHVAFTRDGYEKWGNEVRALLESIRHPDKWEKRWD